MPLFPSVEVKPTVTEGTLPEQSNKVFIVTGSNTGVGEKLVEILYSHHAKVYVAARSKESSMQTIARIRSENPSSKGDLIFLPLDLADLTSVRDAARSFLSRESRLHILWNNAGVMIPPQGSKTKQGYELQLGTNCLGPFLLTKLLTPILLSTVEMNPSGTVRVVWVSSDAARRFSPQGGVALENLNYKEEKPAWYKYGTSKAGNILYGSEMARRYNTTGLISVSVNPGNLDTNLYQHMGKIMRSVAKIAALHKPIYGAYSELYAGFSKDIGMGQNGAFIEPWGVISKMRDDIDTSTKPTSEGGSGVAEAFWTWSEEQVAEYE